jgi:predicted phosphodiesterase
MASKPTYKKEIATEYCIKYSKWSTMAIARKLNEDHPYDFKTIDNARGMVRACRGERSDRYSPTVKKRTDTEREQMIKHTFHLPESDYKEIEPLHIAKNIKSILFLTDIHLPYQDNNALKIALDYGKAQKVDCIYLNGDTMDMYQASRYVKDRRLRDLPSELEMTRQFLKSLVDEFQCPVYYKIGNHEVRFENYLMLNAPEMLGINDFELRNLLRFGELGIIEVKSTQFTYAGKLALLHGHEFGHSVFSPVNPARGLYMRAKKSSIIGHHHQSSEHSEKDLGGNVVTCWSVGALCGLQPLYFPINKWNHGFAHIHVNPDGSYEVDNLKIINGKIR